MKKLFMITAVLLAFAACQPPADNSANEMFKKNSATVMAYLKAFQAENIDYTIFSDDFVSVGTSFGSQKDQSLQEMIDLDKRMMAAYDFKLLGMDSLILLPGVDQKNLTMNGSVRYYGLWEVTKPATDSTAAKTGRLAGYESFDFNEDGKIRLQQIYGDAGSLFQYLNSKD